MLFNSYTFILFFGIVLLLHSLPLPWRARKFQLLVASYLFYAAWNPPFVVLLWVSTLVDWFVAGAIGRLPTQPSAGATAGSSGSAGTVGGANRGTRRGLLLVSLATNLGLLGFFKYGNFVLENFTHAMAALGVDYQPPALDIVLPVGISFYTFQSLSYTIDVYRGQMRPWPSFLDFALYVTFFPQLVAGPIVRSGAFLPQCSEPRRATATQLGWGLSLLVLGLFEKVVIADSLLAPIADLLYTADAPPTALAAWSGTLAFAGQIFCDFAGYSTCAIGAGMCLGFSIPDNFRYPYAAIGFSDFWRRWHISLSTWLRDYLYIPLGGSRKGSLRTYVNLMLTMLIGGLWHGASWTFVVWGGLHGLYLAVERLLRGRFDLGKLYEAKAPGATAGLSGSAGTVGWTNRGTRQRTVAGGLGLAAALSTFALTTFAWAFFRAGSFGQAFHVAGAMLGLTAYDAQSPFVGLQVARTLVLVAAILLIHWRMRDTTLEAVMARVPWWLRSLALALMLFAIATKPGEDRAFIYFQF